MNELTLEKMLEVLNPEVVASLKLAVEIGKWPDGRRLTKEQREICLQAVIAWDMKNLPEEERIGYVNKDKGEDACDDTHHHHDGDAPVKFLH